MAAKAAGLDIITWTIERSGRIVEDVLIGSDTFYYQSTLDAISNDGDILVTLDVLVREGRRHSGHFLRLARHSELLR